jgi:hypothetical protein
MTEFRTTWREYSQIVTADSILFPEVVGIRKTEISSISRTDPEDGSLFTAVITPPFVMMRGPPMTDSACISQTSPRIRLIVTKFRTVARIAVQGQHCNSTVAVH